MKQAKLAIIGCGGLAPNQHIPSMFKIESQLQNSRFAGIQKTESRIKNEILTQIQFVLQLF